MQQALGRYAIAGTALAGAGLIAAFSALAPGFTGVQARQVALTSGSEAAALGDFDLSGPWQDAFDTAADNVEPVFHALGTATGNLFQTIADEPEALTDNLQDAWQAVTLIGADGDLANAVVEHTIGGSGSVDTDPESNEQPTDAGDNVHGQLYDGLTGQDPDEYQVPDGYSSLADLVNLISSPLSGALMGIVGPAVSPEVALLNSLDDVAGDLTGDDADPQAVVGDLLDTPANMVDAFFNGATLDLDPLVPVVQDALLAGDDTEDLEGLDLAFGGLFSPGDVQTGVGGQDDGVGGSLLNSIGFTLDVHEPQEDGEGYIGTMDADGEPVGPVAGIAGFEDVLAQALGGDLLG